jgi:hypothetical protein
MDDREGTVGESGDMQDEAAEMQRLQEEIRNLPVADHLLYMMHSLSALAVGRLGLSGEGPHGKDLGQARLAIDAFKALAEVMERARPDEVSANRGMVSQLQLAYVAALDEGRAGSDAAPRPEDGTAPEDDATPED